MRSLRRNAGFSMVELLTVIMIILFLMALIAIVFVNHQRTAKMRATKALLQGITLALHEYEKTLREVPPDTGFGQEIGSRAINVTIKGNPEEIVLYDSGSLWRYLGQEVTKHIAEVPGGPRVHEVGKFGPFYKFSQETMLRSYNDPKYGDSWYVIDPWGQPIGYVGDRRVRTFEDGARYGGRVLHNRDGFDLFSSGPDKKTASDDEKDNGWKGTGVKDNLAYNGADDDSDGVIDNATELGESQLNGALTAHKAETKTDGKNRDENEILDDINNWDD